jgi:hypothetical protein
MQDRTATREKGKRVTEENPGVKYAKGKKFRVVREGAKVQGMQAKQGYHQGWSRPLAIGEVVESKGFEWGWGSDPGQEVHFIVDDIPSGVSCIEVGPLHYGPMTAWPQDGYLEEITESEDASA